LNDEGITQFRVPIGSLAVIVLAACLAGMLAAVTPGRRAARLDVLRAVVSD
jgi:putative ABC transport system permease protein